MIIFSIKATRNYYTIYVNGKMHLKFKNADFVCVESWREPSTPDYRVRGFKEIIFVVEFYFKTTKITCEYDTIEKWEQVLTLVDTKIK